jgi:adenine-specific DNA-methyltransferase
MALDFVLDFPDASNGERLLMLDRNIQQRDNEAWFKKPDYTIQEMVYDIACVNFDSNLEKLCRPDPTWKVRLIEQECQRLMFDEENV